MSLQKVYETGLKHALLNIEKQGGRVEGDTIRIATQSPARVRFEKSFDGHYPVGKIPVTWSAARDEISFDFEGIGFVMKGDASKGDSNSSYIFNTELYIDGQLVERPKLPVSFTTRRHELCWKYQMPKAKHHVSLKILNPSREQDIRAEEAIIYSDRALVGMEVNTKAAQTKSTTAIKP
jgi:hypothetical protein